MVKSVVKTFCRCFFKRQIAEKVNVFKGFQRFRKLTAGNCLHAPKPRALPTALHPDSVFRSARRGALSFFLSRKALFGRKHRPVCRNPLGRRVCRRSLLTCTLGLSPGPCGAFLFFWGEIWDSNPRPSGPQPDALTNCANPTISSGVPWGIRTLDLLLRRQLLYPTELKAQSCLLAFLKPFFAKNQQCLPFMGTGTAGGASDGNRTHATSLEGWNSTIELHSHSLRRSLQQVLWYYTIFFSFCQGICKNSSRIFERERADAFANARPLCYQRQFFRISPII